MDTQTTSSVDSSTAQQAKRPHVVIIGGGFGGIKAAHALDHAPVDITLIDRNNHHVFQFLFFKVGTA